MEKWNSTGEFSSGKRFLNRPAGKLWIGALVYVYHELCDFMYVVGFVKADDQHDLPPCLKNDCFG